MCEIVKFNKDHLRLEIGHLERDSKEYDVRQDVFGNLRSSGNLYTLSQACSNLLGIDLTPLELLSRAFEEAKRQGDTILAIGVGVRRNGDYFVRFADSSKKLDIRKPNDEVGVGYVVLRNVEEGTSVESLIKHFNETDAIKIAAFLNNRLYGYKVETPADEEYQDWTYFVQWGAFSSLEAAEQAARENFPNYCYSEEEFSKQYRLTSPEK